MSKPIDDESIPLAAEDKFVVIGIRDAPKLCPSYESGELFSFVLTHAQSCLGELVPVFDLRGLEGFYNDVADFIDGLAGSNAHVLLGRKDLPRAGDLGLRERGFKIIPVRGRPMPVKSIDIAPLDVYDTVIDSRSEIGDDLLFEVTRAAGRTVEMEEITPEDYEDAFNDPWVEILESIPRHRLAEDALRKALNTKVVGGIIDRYVQPAMPPGLTLQQLAISFMEFMPHISELLRNPGVSQGFSGDAYRDLGLSSVSERLDLCVRASYLHAFLRHMHRHSMLIEYVMACRGDDVVCMPYHSKAIHEVEFPQKADVLVARPGVIAQTTASVMSHELTEFQRLINSTDTRERHIQQFLESHPSFLRGLNYKNIYPQLVLQRDDDTSLIPDFLLEPFDDAWCDILDVKLPRQKIIVGRKDRATLASGIHEVVAQLREYAAYFEQEKYQRYVREKYGLKVYRPRLIALVGRDMWQMTNPEVRRAMTSYENVQVLTFDMLLQHSRNRMLI